MWIACAQLSFGRHIFIGTWAAYSTHSIGIDAVQFTYCEDGGANQFVTTANSKRANISIQLTVSISEPGWVSMNRICWPSFRHKMKGKNSFRMALASFTHRTPIAFPHSCYLFVCLSAIRLRCRVRAHFFRSCINANQIFDYINSYVRNSIQRSCTRMAPNALHWLFRMPRTLADTMPKWARCNPGAHLLTL